MLSLIKTTRGGLKVIDEDSYLYIKHRETSEKSHWRCDNFKGGCKARLVTNLVKFGEIPKCLHRNEEVHDHSSDIGKVKAKETMNKLKESLSENRSYESTRSLIANTASNHTNDVRNHLPNTESIGRSIRKWRQKAIGSPAIPVGRTGFDIPESISKFENRTDFINYDSGPDDAHRILIMSSPATLKTLSDSRYMAVDATFRVCPDAWYQLASVHAVSANWSIPCLFALLPDKKQSTYVKLFKQLKAIIPEFSPEYCIADFETALQNGVRSVFPQVNLGGCLFHLNQNCYRKICDLGYRKEYNNNPIFQRRLKLYPALSFLPIDKILPTFRKIAEDPETPIDFVSYFEENYVGVIRGAGVNQRLEAPKFAPEMWNVRSRVLADLPRSNNACEGFHNALRSSITASHPNIWRLLVALKQELSLSELKIMQKSRGDRPDKKKSMRY